MLQNSCVSRGGFKILSCADFHSSQNYMNETDQTWLRRKKVNLNPIVPGSLEPGVKILRNIEN